MRFNTLSLPVHYFVWHYGGAFRDIFRIETNIMWFLYNFFSLSILFKTFFSPWRRLSENKNEDAFWQRIIINTIMRLVGFLARLVTVISGLFIILIAFIVSVAFYVIWFLLPAIVVVLLIGGAVSLTL
ncbi:MAG: hypothetical protein Q8P86_02130 [bacterium]|nr:hypothetical protein [bacterium]